MRFLLIPSVFIILSCISYAESKDQCLSGSANNQIFKNAIQTSKASLVKDFRKTTSFKSSEGRLACTSGSCDEKPKPTSLQSEVMGIPKECIKASLKRKISQSSYECRRTSQGNWGLVSHSPNSSKAPCFDDTTVDYIQHVSNRVLSCFQGLSLNGVSETVDPKVFYGIWNNESGFNFTYSYPGGVGAAQLTEWAVQEMNVLNPARTSGKVEKGQGRYILDAVLNSKKSECASLRPIIKNDLKFKYHSPTKPNCEWTSLETGLARNLVYSMGFFSFLKNQVIGRELKKRAPSALKDPELMNLLTTIAYGPGGRKRALAYIRTYRMGGPQTSLDNVKAKLRNESYLLATSRKMKEVKNIAGDSCRFL